MSLVLKARLQGEDAAIFLTGRSDEDTESDREGGGGIEKEIYSSYINGDGERERERKRGGGRLLVS